MPDETMPQGLPDSPYKQEHAWDKIELLIRTVIYDRNEQVLSESEYTDYVYKCRTCGELRLDIEGNMSIYDA